MRPCSYLVVSFCALLAAASPLFAAPVNTEHVEAEIISRYAAVEPGKPIEAALRLKIIDKWHTYWKNPGDSGLPTKISWSLPPGFSASAIDWPHPKRLPLGPLMNFGFEGEAMHMVFLQTPAQLKPGQSITLNAKAEWLVCHDVCIPESAALSLTLPVVSAAPLVDRRFEKSFADARVAVPGALLSWKVAARAENSNAILTLTPPPGDKTTPAGLFFYATTSDIISNAAKQVLNKTADGWALSVPLAEPINTALATFDGVLVSEQGWGTAHAGRAVAIAAPLAFPAVATKTTPAPMAARAPAADLGLALALLFAFVGGLILNLMPCVFPVLGIKVMSFVEHAGGEQKRLRQQGVAFLGGVLVSFWVLAGLLLVLRAAGESIGWGFQLQSPVFVTLLAMLFLLMALNLSGVFEFGLRLQSAAGNVQSGVAKGVLRDAFLSGVLATVIATPCTAPFMGASLGYTLAQPAYVSMLVFTAVALGMAAPILALSMFPAWLRHLPRPGAWMDSMKQFMAFPLYATVAWLVWVVGSQQGNDGVGFLLMGMVVIALGAWFYGRWQMPAPTRAVAFALALLLVGGVIAWPGAPAERVAATGTEAWIAFSKEKVAELRLQGRPVFIDFTATWCITCQVNKRVAINQPEVVKRFAELKVARLKADWTVQDPLITAALAEFGRNGVPLYVYYPVAGEAILLPEVLTSGILLAALDTPRGATAK